MSDDLSPEFEARRTEACARIESIVEEFEDVFGIHACDDDDVATEDRAAGVWALLGWVIAMDWQRLDRDGPASEYVRVVAPRSVSYTHRIGLLETAKAAAI